MKARRVKHLDGEAPFADNAQRIVSVRLAELFEFLPAALDPTQLQPLHDMRIAAKRLRYALELTGFCFGSYAAEAARHARELQELIGEVHDCDVMLDRLSAHLEQLRDRDARVLAEAAGTPAGLSAAMVDGVPGRTAYRGVELLIVHQQAQRQLRFERFRVRWAELERAGLRERLERALAERPGGRAREAGPSPVATVEG